MLALQFALTAPNAIAAEPNQLTPEQAAAGWISLFDGETLFGWQPTSKADWKVENGLIRVTSGEQGFLMTGSEFADYELHVEFQAPAMTNSGVFLHMPQQPADPARDCYELNIAPPDNPFPTGSLVGRSKAEGAISINVNSFRLKTPKPLNAWDGNWHAFDVAIHGGAVSVSFDANLVNEYDDPDPLQRGRIGLQFREGEVAFRNIRLKPLGLKPMLNGKDLAGWNTKNVEASKFEVVKSEASGSLPLEGRAGEGGEAGTRLKHPSLALPIEGRGPEESKPAFSELQVTNGRGILETTASYGDFVMQLDCFVNGDNLNSGVFFRSIPGEYAQGYESQIHNGMNDGDPTKPSDFGSGGIYRRIAARRIVAKDREWFTKTIVATGPHMAVWVNGYQVTDWTDERPADENPRAGLRLAPGTISLQGHDPTTNLRFRNLNIAELPKQSDHGGTEDTEN